MELSKFATLASESSGELGAHDRELWDHQTGSRWTLDDAQTAMFVASARSIVLELVRRVQDITESADNLIDEQDARIAELEAMVGLALMEITNRAQWIEGGTGAIVRQLASAVPDANAKFDAWHEATRDQLAGNLTDP